MSTIFLKILNISFTAGWLILAVVALRLLLSKAPKWIACLLWGLVALRLLIPFSIESAMSLIPSSEVVSQSIVSNQSPAINTGFTIVNEAVNPIITETFAPQPEASINPMQIIVSIATVIWIVGMVAMFIYAIVSYIKIKKQVSTATPVSVRTREVRRRIMVCDDIKSPFILGIFKPVIYIPSNLDWDTIEYVCAHENAHIKRHDNWWKPLGFILLSIYWFNPLCWLAYVLLSKDIEAACDEKVIKDKDKNYLALYSQALLDCAVQRRRISACPLAFGENNVKGRVKGVLNYKKPAFWIIIIALVAIVVVAVCFLTNPPGKKLKKNPPEVYFGFDNDEMLTADCVGFADPETVKNATVVYSDTPGIKKSNEELEQIVVTLHGDDSQNLLYLGYSDKPTNVKVEYYDEINPSDNTAFDVAEYDMKTNTLVVSPDSNYTYIVTAEWGKTGIGKYLFRIARDGIEEPGDIDEKDIQTIHFSGEIPPSAMDSDGEIELDFPALVEFECVDGQYVVEGDQVYKYKMTLVGKDPGASLTGKFVVLTNNPDIAYETVSRSLFSSNSDDWLTDTAIVSMEVITDEFEGFSVWPTTSTVISRGYDENDHPETDIPGETGDPVYAIADGTVFYTGFDQKKGNTIKLLSSDAVIEYTHLNSISVEEGADVKAGSIIGELGNTGLSTGPHLGLALTVNGLSKDMKDYYKN